MQLTDREYGLQGVHWYCDIFHTLLHQNVSKKTPQKLELVLFPKKVRKKVALCRNYPKVWPFRLKSMNSELNTFKNRSSDQLPLGLGKRFSSTKNLKNCEKKFEKHFFSQSQRAEKPKNHKRSLYARKTFSYVISGEENKISLLKRKFSVSYESKNW